MTQATTELLEAATRLPPAERLELVQRIMETLDAPDPQIAAQWAAEAHARYLAWQRGEIAAIDEADVFGDLDPR